MIEYDEIDLDKIIDKRISKEEYMKMYENGHLNYAEISLLNASKNFGFILRYLLGYEEYRIPYDSSVSEKLYFTNVPLVLDSFYSLYKKFPDYHFDQILKIALEYLSNRYNKMYQFLVIYNEQMKNEKNNKSPFKITNVDMLKTCRKKFELMKPYFQEEKFDVLYAKKSYLDVITDLNEDFKSELNFDIFNHEEDMEQNEKNKSL